MTDKEFLEELRQIVERRAATMHLVDTLAFVSEVSERLEQDPAFGEFISIEYQGVGSRKRTLKLHGHTTFDDADGTMGLVVGKWSDASSPETLTTADVKELTGWMENFATEAIEQELERNITEANAAYSLANSLRVDRAKISRIRLHILTNLSLSQRFKEEKVGSVAGIPLERHIWDLQRLKAIYESSREREAVSILLEEFDVPGIPFLEAAATDDLKSYLCVVDGSLLADLFERYGSRLLEGNVRSFLGMKGGVNKGIRNTIQDNPELFFAYNNGIAATASTVDVARKGGQAVITKLVDLQIVNGGQTTASVLSARKKDKLSLQGVTVQMKLTCVSDTKANELIPKIARYANTQNKIAAADFFANHPFHRKMHEISRRLTTPARSGVRVQSKWFYEKARGEYQNERLYLPKSKKDLFDAEYPSQQVINKTVLGQLDSVWNCKPQWSSLGPQKNFLKFAAKFEPRDTDKTEAEYWDEISPNFGDAYYQRIVALELLWQSADEIFQEGRSSWFQGDYKPPMIAYTLSMLFHSTRSAGFEVNVAAIWNKQAVSPELKRHITDLAMLMQRTLLHPPEGAGRVDQWVKKDQCWNYFQGISLPSIAGIRDQLSSKAEFGKARTEGRKQAAQDDAIQIQGELAKLSVSGFWASAANWQKFTSVVPNSYDRDLIRKASTMSGFLKLALEKDWRRLLELKKVIEAEGFRHK